MVLFSFSAPSTALPSEKGKVAFRVVSDWLVAGCWLAVCVKLLPLPEGVINCYLLSNYNGHYE